MSASTAVTNHVRLNEAERRRLRPFARAAVLAATIFGGIAIALQIAMLAPYPGTNGHDNVMRTLSFMVPFAVLGTLFKLMFVPLFGPRIEHHLGRQRPVKIRYVFNREIRLTAILGGALNAMYSMLFVYMARDLAPTALAASRACIVLALVPVELIAHQLPRGSRGRLTLSVVVTLLGAGIVICAHGLDLFKGHQATTTLWVAFFGLLGPGNFILALAEQAEMRGVHKQKTAPPVYTLARFLTFTTTVLIATAIWGLTHHGSTMFWGVQHMMLHRWYLLVPLSFFWALTDLVRICVKTVVPATYMYIVLSLAVAIDAVTQTVAKQAAPKIYTAVPSGWLFPVICLVGGLVVAGGSLLWPHEDHKPAIKPAA